MHCSVEQPEWRMHAYTLTTQLQQEPADKETPAVLLTAAVLLEGAEETEAN